MPSTRAILEQARSGTFTSEDGDEFRLELLPPLSADELDQFEAELGVPLPEEISSLLKLSRGFEFAPLGQVQFHAPHGRDIGFEELLPCCVTLAGDGFGNFWVAEVALDTGDWGPVFYLCHDPPVIAVQALSVAVFLSQVFDLGREHAESAIDFVHDEAARRIWRHHPSLLSVQQALDSGDAGLADFASQLHGDHFICDLREPSIGDGFAWGRYGPETAVRRAAGTRLFAIAVPARRGLLASLFGR